MIHPVTMTKWINDNLIYDMFEQKTTIFDAREVPNIDVTSYLKRLYNNLRLNDNLKIISIILLDRIITAQKIILNEYNIHRLLALSHTISTKLYNDDFQSNAIFSQICGMPLTEYNYMEKQFLILIDWNLYITDNTFRIYLNNI